MDCDWWNSTVRIWSLVFASSLRRVSLSGLTWLPVCCEPWGELRRYRSVRLNEMSARLIPLSKGTRVLGTTDKDGSRVKLAAHLHLAPGLMCGSVGIITSFSLHLCDVMYLLYCYQKTNPYPPSVRFNSISSVYLVPRWFLFWEVLGVSHCVFNLL
jgi:hypothetical protein